MSKLKRKNNREWYAVKSLYQTKFSGKPKAKDKYYNDTKFMYEERVVIFLAHSDKEALKLADKEAKDYVKDTIHLNPYGQKVTTIYLENLLSYSLFDPPTKHGREVYSNTFLVDKRKNLNKIIIEIFGKDESKDELKKRKIFLNEEFSGRVY